MTTLGTRAKCDLVTTRARAESLHAKKSGIADAAYVAFAEATADVFISCDDGLVKKCRRENVAVMVVNPVEFVIVENLK